MKTSLTKLSSSFVLLTLSFAAYAKPVAQVVELKGTVFMVTPEGKTTQLKLNSPLEEKAEVMVEDGASITLNDYYDATYHLTGGSHMKFFNKSVQLKKGKSWIQSLNARHPLALTTANGNVNFWKGESITTFDQATSRSQFLVVNGEVEVSNILDQTMKYNVPAGTFTMVDPAVDDGAPRTPTKVGLASLEKALSDFNQLPEKIKSENTVPARAIASVEESQPVKRGEIIFITSSREPASVKPDSHKYFKKVVGKKIEAAPVPIKIYGTSWKNTAPIETPRAPASIQVVAPNKPKIMAPALENDREFTESLKTHHSQQPKFSKELESLIQDLKSY
jgi:hypothetical protein